MRLKTEQQIIDLILQDRWMMNILHDVQTLNLPDWWVCAGFVRSKIWDTLHQFNERTPLADIDVVYFDKSDIAEATEKTIENQLRKCNPTLPWSVKNEARMHLINGFKPYSSSVDAISKFPETVTALGLKLSDEGKLLLTAPHGVNDVLRMEVKPTPYYNRDERKIHIYHQRVASKNWKATWHNITLCSQ